MKSFAIVLGLVVVLSASRARAEADLDAASIAVKVCRDRPGLVAAEKAATTAGARADLAAKRVLQAELCKTDWARYEGKQYPLNFILKFHPDVCAQLKALGSNDDRASTDDLCAGASFRAAPSFGAVGINLVLGLGDLLQAEAKQEVLDYLLEQVGKKFCNYKQGDIELRKWFTHTCDVLFPPGAGSSIDAATFNFGDLKDAFNQDLQALPGNIGSAAYARIKQRWPGADPYLAAAGALLVISFELIEHKKPGQIFEDLGAAADRATTEVRCDLTNPDDAEQKKNRKACAALLLFQLARTGAKAYSLSGAPHLSVIIQDGLITFCEVHGVTGKTASGDCVIDATHYEEWHTRLLEFWRAAKRMIDLQVSLDLAARVALPAELSKRAGPEIVADFRELVRTFSNILEAVSPADKDHIAEDAALVDLVLDVYEALVSDDPAALRKGLLGLLASPIIGAKLSPATARAITAVISLATAKDRTEVNDLLAELVAPVGSYKSKYGADHVVVTINGFVGFFAGGEYRMGVHSSEGAAMDPVRAYAPLKLAAPVGLDVTLWSSRNAHLGVFVSAIDPLALDVSDDHGTLHADWLTLFAPGAYVRVGGFRSPFSIAVGASYQVGRRSVDSCGAARCFDGALQFGAFLSADVPLLSLR